MRKLLGLLACLLLVSGPAWAIATYDTQNTVQGAGGSGASHTIGITVGNNSNRLLIVHIRLTGSGLSVSSVSSNLNGAFTYFAREEYVAANVRGEVWRLIAPDVGAHTITFVLSSDTSYRTNAVSYYNVDQTTPLSGWQSTYGTTAKTTAGITCTTSDLLLGFGAIPYDSAVGGGETRRSFSSTGGTGADVSEKAGSNGGTITRTNPRGDYLAVGGACLTSSADIVADPTFSAGTGTYNNDQSITLSTTTSGATICYTTDGSTPGAATPGTCDSSPTQTYSGAISVTATATTIKALGTKAAYTNSGVASATYTLTVATPTYDHDTGTYWPDVTVAISDATTSAAIVYCTDLIDTCTPSTSYTTGILINTTGTYLRSKATKASYNDSAIKSALYTLSAPPSGPPIGSLSTLGVGR